jgi:hypothetical protein
MTVEKDTLRADLRESMNTATPDYVIDSEAGRRVGKVIGATVRGTKKGRSGRAIVAVTQQIRCRTNPVMAIRTTGFGWFRLACCWA